MGCVIPFTSIARILPVTVFEPTYPTAITATGYDLELFVRRGPAVLLLIGDAPVTDSRTGVEHAVECGSAASDSTEVTAMFRDALVRGERRWLRALSC